MNRCTGPALSTMGAGAPEEEGAGTRRYDLRVRVREYQSGREGRIRAALEETWGFDPGRWCEAACGQCTEVECPAECQGDCDAPALFAWGEDEWSVGRGFEELSGHLATAVWQANGDFCPVQLQGRAETGERAKR